MIGGLTGPFVMQYVTRGTGAMLSSDSSGWALSAAAVGHGVILGWKYKTERLNARLLKISTPDRRK